MCIVFESTLPSMLQYLLAPKAQSRINSGTRRMLNAAEHDSFLGLRLALYHYELHHDGDLVKYSTLFFYCRQAQASQVVKTL
jgi:hypothetical protein